MFEVWETKTKAIWGNKTKAIWGTKAKAVWGNKTKAFWGTKTKTVSTAISTKRKLSKNNWYVFTP